MSLQQSVFLSDPTNVVPGPWLTRLPHDHFVGGRTSGEQKLVLVSVLPHPPKGGMFLGVNYGGPLLSHVEKLA